MVGDQALTMVTRVMEAIVMVSSPLVLCEVQHLVLVH